DRKRLLQVMTNLLSNAAKFSPEWGKVEITLEESGANVRVGVHDRGPGIPEEFRSRIFGRFAQADSTASRQKGGTGLTRHRQADDRVDARPHRFRGPRWRRVDVLVRAAQTPQEEL
ncbi:MAG TPA: ATP-binding protein, partial [Burkholderiales bacterium]|nr:ATP-binding protein [Burkholderiales bacterium]